MSKFPYNPFPDNFLQNFFILSSLLLNIMEHAFGAQETMFFLSLESQDISSVGNSLVEKSLSLLLFKLFSLNFVETKFVLTSLEGFLFELPKSLQKCSPSSLSQ